MCISLMIGSGNHLVRHPSQVQDSKTWQINKGRGEGSEREGCFLGVLPPKLDLFCSFLCSLISHILLTAALIQTFTLETILSSLSFTPCALFLSNYHSLYFTACCLTKCVFYISLLTLSYPSLFDSSIFPPSLLFFRKYFILLFITLPS